MSGTLGFEGDTFDNTVEPLGEGLSPGAMLSSSVRLFRPLRDGGMGSVWVAEHLALGTPVAVKFLHRSLVQNDSAATRFRREAAAAARIRSPHVVQILDQGVTDGLPYIVMELLEGETLEASLTRRGPIGVAETVEIVRQVGRVLAKAHDLGVTHRDIKPDNLILIEGEMEPFVKVIDFGIAKTGDDAGRITTAGLVMGTPQYMSPEQLAGCDVNGQTDLWALGVIAYRCLTGALPFDGDDMVAVATAMAEDQFVPPSMLCAGIPPRLDAWFDRIFDTNPNRRFENARSMLADLELALHHAAPAPPREVQQAQSGVSAYSAPNRDPLELASTLPSLYRPTSTTAGRRAISRSPLLLVATATLALLAMGGGAFAWASMQHSTLENIPNWLGP